MFDFQKFKNLRLKKKIKQNEIAKLLGKHARTIQRWETGKSIPSKHSINLMANILGVKSDLISDIKTASQKFGLTKESSDIYKRQTKTDLEKQIEYFSIQKNMEELKEEKEMLWIEAREKEEILDHLEEALYKKDEHLKFIYVNLPFYRLFKIQKSMPHEEKVYRNFMGFSCTNELLQIEQEVLKTGNEENDLTLKLKKVDGEEFWGRVLIKRLLKENGKYELLVVIRDITLRKKLFARMAVFEKFNIETNVLMIMQKLTPYRHNIFVSEATNEIYGADKGKFYTDVDYWKKFIHPEDKELALTETDKYNNETSYRIITDKREVKNIGFYRWRTEIEGEELDIIRIMDLTKYNLI